MIGTAAGIEMMSTFRTFAAAKASVLLVLAACSQPAPPGPPASPETAPPSSSAPGGAPMAEIVPPGSEGQPFAAARTWLAEGVAGRQAWFICDGIDAGRVMAVGLPDAAGNVEVLTWLKSAPHAPTRQSFRLGEPDPGAGQVYWALNNTAGQMQGNLHAFNPGALDDPAGAVTPTFTSMQVGSSNVTCRWVARVRLVGFSDKRTYLITQAPDGVLTYQTFDFKDAASAASVQPDGAQQTTAPSLQIKGGEESPGGFVFHNEGYTYAVSARPTSAGVSVVNDAGPVGRESLIAWTLAPKLS